jgi:BirA family transcriptional regulator, biotin operon repressor / biotin---[acetyl-CoA-carboxylase] ligase
MELDPSAAAGGVRLVVHDTVGSTNAEALACARAGDPGPLWVAARRQTAGRGRRGRAWVSEPGNLHASLLLTDPSPPRHAPELSFVSALALHDAIAELAPGLALRLTFKWPNDLLVDRAKLAGILVEGEDTAAHGLAAAVGIGVNCVHHPTEASYAAVDLQALGNDVTAVALLRGLSATMARRLRQWDRGAGFPAVRRDWLARASGIGEPIRVRTAHDHLEGVFAALDAAGRLVLAAPDGTTRVIGAGEVFPSIAEPPPRSGVLQ